MVRTCARRVSHFLQRVQRHFSRIESLEQKAVDEIVDFVEAEFWACDPLLCLWEEVSLPSAEIVRYRIGPFCIDNQGKRTFEPEFDGSPQMLRVPLWIFAPSQAHFRCLSEWSLVSCERLRQMPAGESGGNCGCCCVPGGFCKKSAKKSKKTNQPSMGSLSTSLAAHFVHWVEKNEEMKGIFERFARLYSDPEEVTKLASAGGLKAMPGDTTPLSDKEEAVCPPNILASGPEKVAESKARSPGMFSAACRQHLLEGLGNRQQPFVELATRVRCPAQQSVVDAERQEGQALPNPADSNATGEYVANPAAHVAMADRFTAWSTAGFMLHYERMLEEGGGQADPVRPELRRAGSAMSKSMKAFAGGDLRARREQHNQTLRQRLDRVAAKEDSVPEPPEDALQVKAGPTSVTPAMPSSHVEGINRRYDKYWQRMPVRELPAWKAEDRLHADAHMMWNGCHEMELS
ncbi:unnamed protein product [Effrenium voratum]|nr:unnamed protein product [Effrenium voratum]